MKQAIAKSMLFVSLLFLSASAVGDAVYSDCLRFLDKAGNLVAPLFLPDGMKVVTVNGKDAFFTKEPADDKDLNNPYNFVFKNALAGYVWGWVGRLERAGLDG
jgi:hypothetical protein